MSYLKVYYKLQSLKDKVLKLMSGGYSSMIKMFEKFNLFLNSIITNIRKYIDDLISKKEDYNVNHPDLSRNNNDKKIKIKTIDDLVEQDFKEINYADKNKKQRIRDNGEYIFRKSNNKIIVDCCIDTTMETNPFSIILDAKPMYVVATSSNVKYLMLEFNHYMSIRTKLRPVIKDDNSILDKNNFYLNDYVVLIADQVVDITKIRYRRTPIPNYIEIITMNENDEMVSIKSEVKLVIKMLDHPIFILTVTNSDMTVLLGSVAKIGYNIFMAVKLRKSKLTGNTIIVLRHVNYKYENYNIGNITDGFGNKL